MDELKKCPFCGGESITQQQKSKIYELFEKEDALAEELFAFIEELQKRLSIADSVCWAAHRYIKHINSPVATGWDELIDALQKWTHEITVRKSLGAD